MLSYLKGTIVATHKPAANRVILTLDVGAIGYDLQITSRLLSELPSLGETAQVFTHLSIRDDQLVLFGFGSVAERDLFRQLISVSGVGPQVAMALLDTLGLHELLQAIVGSNTRALSHAPGVGSKTAERIALELKTRLAEWRQQVGLIAPLGGPVMAVQTEVEMTLLALGYTPTEISQALQAVGQSTTLAKNADVEEWIRQTIGWLSR